MFEPKLVPAWAGLPGVLLNPPGEAKGLPGWLPEKLKTKLGTLPPSLFFDLENFLLLFRIIVNVFLFYTLLLFILCAEEEENRVGGKIVVH